MLHLTNEHFFFISNLVSCLADHKPCSNCKSKFHVENFFFSFTTSYTAEKVQEIMSGGSLWSLVFLFCKINKNVDIFADSYSLHINCGGKEVTISGTTFEGDVDPGEPSVFVSSKTNWGFSNTGLFLYDTGVSVDYIELNHSLNFPTPYSELYESARVSPISLTYYAYCLGNGNYRISLHFSEIVLTNDTKLGGHGRRVFNIYIQVNYDRLFFTW